MPNLNVQIALSGCPILKIGKSASSLSQFTFKNTPPSAEAYSPASCNVEYTFPFWIIFSNRSCVVSSSSIETFAGLLKSKSALVEAKSPAIGTWSLVLISFPTCLAQNLPALVGSKLFLRNNLLIFVDFHCTRHYVQHIYCIFHPNFREEKIL